MILRQSSSLNFDFVVANSLAKKAALRLPVFAALVRPARRVVFLAIWLLASALRMAVVSSHQSKIDVVQLRKTLARFDRLLHPYTASESFS